MLFRSYILLAVIGWAFYSWLLARPPAHMRGDARPDWDWAGFLLVQALFGIGATVQRAYASGIAGEIPMDQSLPEVWVDDATQHGRAKSLLHDWQHTPHRQWACPGCQEIIDGPFEQCWNCGHVLVA